MKCYKGFDKDLKCRGYQYEIGREYEEKEAEICSKGFHACEYPLDVFGYYDPASSRYCEVDLDANNQTDGDSKRVGKHIKIGAEIGIPGIVKASVEYIKNQVDWDNSKESNTGNRSAATNTGDQSAATNTGNQSAATNTGNRSAATNTGDQSAATNTGDQSAATNTGNRSAATNTGNRSAATNTGYYSAAEVSGKESIAMAMGCKSKAKGALGCFLVLAEWSKVNGEYHIVDVKAVKVDGTNIKEGTYYTLENGLFVEADNE